MGVDQAMGGGDIKMSMMIGAFVGVEGIALTVFIASALAIVIALARSIPAALARNEDSDMEMVGLIPFGVFMAAGGAISYVWGDAMVAWYVKSLLGVAG
jgi:prepilin signal peptidase PulO-like enzyme (type II secretory pathway)